MSRASVAATGGIASIACCAAVVIGVSAGAGVSPAAGVSGGGRASSAAALSDAGPPEIAFVRSVRSTSVWVADGDGRHARRLGAATDPVLSPNGAMVAASAFGPKQAPLVIFRVAGGRARVPAALDGKISVTPLAWSPDSRYLAVAVVDSSTGQGPGDAALDVIDTTDGSISAHDGGVVAGASFEPGTSDTVAFGLAQSQQTTAPANLYSMPADGSSAARRLTSDGRSINPVWGRRGIVFDRVTPRRNGPGYQLVLLHGSRRTRITHMRVPRLLQGLVPIGVSGNGTRVVAEYEGEDTAEGYSVNLVTRRVRELKVPDQEDSAFGITRDGRRILVSYGGFEAPSTHAVIATVPFRGGAPKPLIHGAYQPSWDL